MITILISSAVFSVLIHPYVIAVVLSVVVGVVSYKSTSKTSGK